MRLLQRLARERTVVSVLHDLPLALHADRLVVLHEGQVRVQGAHDDPAVHAALVDVFERAIRIQRMGERFVALPDLGD